MDSQLIVALAVLATLTIGALAIFCSGPDSPFADCKSCVHRDKHNQRIRRFPCNTKKDKARTCKWYKERS